MMQPTNRYRYVITNRLGVLQAAPLGESNFTIEWEKDTEGRRDYKKNLPSKIVFNGPVYTQLLKIERSIYRCEPIDLSVERLCVTGGVETWVAWFAGRMSLNEGDWNLDRCEVEIKLDDIPAAACLADVKSQEVDILVETLVRRSVYVTPTNIEIEKVTYSFTDELSTDTCPFIYWGGPGTPAEGGWETYQYTNTKDFSEGACESITKWAREVIYVGVLGPYPSSEWVLVEDNWPLGNRKYARPARTYGCIYTQPDFTSVTTQVTDYTCKVLGDEGTNILLDNGVPLEAILDMFMDKFCPGTTVVSNFFQINPDVPSDINYVTGQKTKTKYLTFYQKSDVKRPGASSNATKMLISFDKFITSLVTAFNLGWSMEAGVLRIEHVSYYSNTLGLDLTLPRYAPFVNAIHRYSYKTEDLPSREEFKWVESGGGDFAGRPIFYTKCITRPNNVKTHTIDKMMTDVELALSNPDPDSNKVADEGIVMVAADADGAEFFIISEATILGGNLVNNSVAWAQLHRDYHKHDRPVDEGKMNDVQTTFLSVKPTKKGATVRVPLCCGDVFSPNDKVKTILGEGVVDKATFSFKDDTLVLDLLYPANTGLTNNLAPVALNDTAATNVDIPILITVLTNDSDPEGAALTVEIVSAPFNGTAVVQPNGQVLYTPAPGYVGDDYFTYRVRDDWNEPSGNGLVAIIVHPSNAAPNAVNDTYTTNKDVALVVPAPGIFANDSDDVSFSLFSHSAPSSGTLSVGGTGGINFTPAAGFTGVVTFTYTIQDGAGLQDTATVTINVIDPDLPVAVTDNYQTRKNNNLIVPAPGVLANDTTPTGTNVVSVTGALATVNGGTLTINANGSFTYVPPTGFVGDDSVVYTISNGTNTDTGTINIKVLPDIYVKLTTVNLYEENVPFEGCETGLPWAQHTEFATYRLNFYSNAGGTTPLDVTGLGLTVNLQQTEVVGAPGNPPSSAAVPVAVTGTQFDAFTNFAYYFEMYDCDEFLINYSSIAFSVQPGLYTVI